MGIVVILILIFGLSITFQLQDSLSTTLTEELEKQGVAITRDLAARSTDLILTNNHFDLYQLLKDTVKNNETVRYALILSTDSHVLSHSFTGGIPVGLTEFNQTEEDSNYQLKRLDTDEGLIIDVAVPIFGGRAGTARIGMSTDLLHETVMATTWYWIMVTGSISILALIATYTLTSVLTNPIKQLVRVTKAITRGDLQQKAPIQATDEIGRLAMAFNEMTDSLTAARNESETFQAELLRRNLELAALNRIASEISHSRGLTDMMRRVLSKVAEFMDLYAGWVNIFTENNEQANIICHIGLTNEVIQKLESVNFSNCQCNTAVMRKSPILIGGSKSTCPILKQKLSNGHLLRYHVAVPLVSKTTVFGLLHIAGSKSSPFTSEHMKLLDAIGRQIGIAIENARLWEELKQREELRGQLLEETISAQEAERKRIARELHDQTGQSLTSLMVGMRMLEKDSPKDIRHRISDMRQLTSQTLNEVHNLALKLRPSSLDDLGLVAALKQYTQDYTAQFGIEADFQVIGLDGRRLLPEVEITLYRIIQESLTNVVKHAEANQVSVLLEARDSKVVAIVEDNGKGFDTKQVSRSPTQMKLGLYGMIERAELINGSLTIESKRGRGTTLFIEVPVKGVQNK
jgi:signal transduction histidine kinase